MMAEACTFAKFRQLVFQVTLFNINQGIRGESTDQRLETRERLNKDERAYF